MKRLQQQLDLLAALDRGESVVVVVPGGVQVWRPRYESARPAPTRLEYAGIATSSSQVNRIWRRVQGELLSVGTTIASGFARFPVEVR